jgi:sugar/nucleoside kinase (ribokinase family)
METGVVFRNNYRKSLPYEIIYKMVDICCVGHITSDKVVTPNSTMYMPGGTALYFSYPFATLDGSYLLVTALAEEEMHYVTALRNRGIEVKVQQSKHTVCFENIYDEDSDHRTQYVSKEADAFSNESVQAVDAKIFHLGPLLAGDISVPLIKALSEKGRVSLDVQGYLRMVKDGKVYSADWPEKLQALAYVDTLKADEAELWALTGIQDVHRAAELVAEWGVKELVITNGSHGSLIYSAGTFYPIPAFPPKTLVDATGCGDTYMAGYLYQRLKGANEEQSGRFAAALATLKMESAGPFKGSLDDVLELLG